MSTLREAAEAVRATLIPVPPGAGRVGFLVAPGKGRAFELAAADLVAALAPAKAPQDRTWFEVWAPETANLLADFSTRVEAIAFVMEQGPDVLQVHRVDNHPDGTMTHVVVWSPDVEG